MVIIKSAARKFQYFAFTTIITLGILRLTGQKRTYSNYLNALYLMLKKNVYLVIDESLSLHNLILSFIIKLPLVFIDSIRLYKSLMTVYKDYNRFELLKISAWACFERFCIPIAREYEKTVTQNEEIYENFITLKKIISNQTNGVKKGNIMSILSDFLPFSNNKPLMDSKERETILYIARREASYYEDPGVISGYVENFLSKDK